MNNKVDKRVIVVGAGIGGLSAGIHLQLQGYQVTIFEANSHPGGRANCIKEQGFAFDTRPTLLNYPWVFEQLFSKAGKNLYDYLELIKIDPTVSFLWQDGTTLSLSSDIHKLATYFETLEPESTPNLLKFFKDNYKRFKLSFDRLVTKNADNYIEWIYGINPLNLLSLGITSSFYKNLQRYFKSRYICEALGSYSMYLGGSPFDLPGIFTILPYGEMAYGLTLPRGGIYALVSAIEKLAHETGVEIQYNSPVAKILIKNEKAYGIELKNGDTIESKAIVSNVDVVTTYNSLLSHTTSKKKLMRISKTKMTPSVLTFYWGIKGKVNHLPHHTIFLPDNYKQAFRELISEGKIPTGLPFYCSIPSASDPSLAPENHSAMFILIPLPLLSQLGNINWNSTISELKQEVLARLKFHGIDLDEHRIVYKRVFTPVDWCKKFGLYDGSAFGAAHTLLQMGPLRLKNYDPEIQGLFFVGASTTPGTGVPMVVISGALTAERVINYVH